MSLNMTLLAVGNGPERNQKDVLKAAAAGQRMVNPDIQSATGAIEPIEHIDVKRRARQI